jgi:hypothetical protein
MNARRLMAISQGCELNYFEVIEIAAAAVSVCRVEWVPATAIANIPTAKIEPPTALTLSHLLNSC